MHHEYMRSVKHATTLYELNDPAEVPLDDLCQTIRLSQSDHVLPNLKPKCKADRQARMMLPAPPIESPAPYSALLDLPEPRVNFEEAGAAINTSLFNAHPKVTIALQRLRSAFIDVTDGSFVALHPDAYHPPGPNTVMNYADRQKTQTERFVERLNLEWRGEALTAVVGELEGVFDFKQYDYEAYCETQLFRFLQMTSLTMGQQLRELLEGSVEELVTFFSGIIYQSKGDAAARPVFNVALTLKNNSVVFEPSLEQVKTAILGSFEGAHWRHL